MSFDALSYAMGKAAGGGGGSSGGANVLTLYADFREAFDDGLFAWLDENKTTEFSSYEEAYAACAGADIIKVIDLDTPGFIYFATGVGIRDSLPVLSAIIARDNNTAYGMYIYLYLPSSNDAGEAGRGF